MGLTCSCPSEGDGIWYYPPEDYSVLERNKGSQKNVGRRCFSCRTKIAVGDLCAIFPRGRAPQHWIEESCHGEEVPLAPAHLCEACADQYFNLTELGYCIRLGDSMPDLLAEYQQLKGAKDGY